MREMKQISQHVPRDVDEVRSYFQYSICQYDGPRAQISRFQTLFFRIDDNIHNYMFCLKGNDIHVHCKI